MFLWVVCMSVFYVAVQADIDSAPKLRQNVDPNCKDCRDLHIVSVDEDFNKLKTDPELSKYVSAVLDRLKTFKVPVHPRIRIFYELLKVGMSDFAHRTADSLYVPDKYNVRVDAQGKA